MFPSSMGDMMLVFDNPLERELAMVESLSSTMGGVSSSSGPSWRRTASSTSLNGMWQSLQPGFPQVLE